MVNDGNKDGYDWDELIMIKNQSLSSRKTLIKYTKAQGNCESNNPNSNGGNNIEGQDKKNLMDNFILFEMNFNLNESANHEEEINLFDKERQTNRK